ncbi:MAG: hypothetical protein IJB98_02070, partial [Clostridia bacterium]|nr:hypothetical protein [Clostridia bacterium]
MKKLKLVLSFVFMLGIMCLGFSFASNKINQDKVYAISYTTNEMVDIINAGECAEKGGAIYLSAGSTYNMSGGEMSGHFAEKGGALYISDGAVFTMTGGTITGNYAKYGGAIYVANGGECYINGGTITGNYGMNAPAIYVEDGGILNVTTTAVINNNTYEKYGNPLEIYVDGTLVETRYIKADTYVINENEMPLTYENCCGYFLDEKLSKCSFGEIALTSEAMGFAPRTADAENYVARLYTRTASDLSNFTFTYDRTTSTYTIQGSSSHAGNLVLPKEYNNVQTSLYSASGWGGAFFQSSTITGITFQEGLKNIPNYTFVQANKLVGDMVFPDSVTTIGKEAF